MQQLILNGLFYKYKEKKTNKEHVWENRLPSRNEQIKEDRKHWASGNEMKKSCQQRIIECIREQNIRPVNTPCTVVINFYERNEKRDLDNIISGEKYIFDSLKICQIIKDDNQKYVKNIKHTFHIDSVNPRIEVEIWEI